MDENDTYFPFSTQCSLAQRKIYICIQLQSRKVQQIYWLIILFFLGLEMAWVKRPPEKAVSGEFFNVTYAVFASDGFYQYAVQNGILSHRYYLL